MPNNLPPKAPVLLRFLPPYLLLPMTQRPIPTKVQGQKHVVNGYAQTWGREECHPLVLPDGMNECCSLCIKLDDDRGWDLEDISVGFTDLDASPKNQEIMALSLFIKRAEISRKHKKNKSVLMLPPCTNNSINSKRSCSNIGEGC